MSSQFSDFSLREAYDFAAHVREEIFQAPHNGWLYYFADAFALDEEVAQMARRPQRRTVLHLAIESVVAQSIEYDCDKADYYTSATWLLESFESHGVVVPPSIDRSARKVADGSHSGASARDTLDRLYRLHSRTCVPKITAEVFTLLFADRAFLLRFSQRIAVEVVSLAKLKDHPDLLERDGAVRRFRAWPTWLRRALLYRDKGHCALCLSDLVGVFSINEKAAHVDHMVSLDVGGTNDPTNLQLLCERCNQRKGTKARTSHLYMTYW